ncbi:MAG: hypothetical protein JO107_10530 [Hyphomicrobiales bacterium]|nr:hypothetical protein [Hyphomicrobiales bacterium]MBV8663526.1 hypothetical protein [Hyphomicrobiales bacterium]
MLKIALTLSALVVAAPAIAQEKGPNCTALEKVQQAAGKDTTVSPLTDAQFHFLQGLYAALPFTPAGLPPGDGALLLTKDKGGAGLIIWTRGPLACDPLPAPEEVQKLLAEIKAGRTDDGEGL